MPFRIAIVNRTGGGMSGGYRAYLRHVLPRLARHADVEAVLCAGPASLELRRLFADIDLSRVTFVDCAPFRFLHPSVDRDLRTSLSAFRPDVLFVPVERQCAIDGIPTVTMVQNMGPLVPTRWKNPWSEQLRYCAQRIEAKRAVRSASHIVAPTAFVKAFLVQEWKIPSERVTVIHYGASFAQEGTRQRMPAAIPPEWSGQFLFTAGSLEPYRGLEDVLGALRILRRQSVPATLVIAGVARKNMRPYHRRLIAWIERHGLSAAVRWVGHLEASEMAWCYVHCRAFVMTSRVETFAVIGAEALASGCVCVVADNPPFPEVFGGAASYYPQRNCTALASTIRHVFQRSTAAREVASAKAKAQANLFSWDENVQTLLSVFHALSSMSRRQQD